MATRVPLPTLLSQPLIAFTIEFDNEFEHRLVHRTSTQAADVPRDAPWLVSMAMWSNFMRFLSPSGTPVRQVRSLVRLTNLEGLKRWGYIVVRPDPADSRAAPPRADWIVRPTAAGRKAQDVWQPLAGIVEDRWRARFGDDRIDRLRALLHAVVSRLEVELPPYLPVVYQAMFADVPPQMDWSSFGVDGVDADPISDLPALFSRVLLAFALDVERTAKLSLCMGANSVRVLTERGVRVRDLPGLTGVSKEAIAMMMGFLARHGYVVIEPDPTATQAKLACLTPRGLRAQAEHGRLVDTVEEGWQLRFGADLIERLRGALHELVLETDDEQPLLSRGLVPYASGWRGRRPYLRSTTAVLRNPSQALPHYPMVLHRGGWPDGS